MFKPAVIFCATFAIVGALSPDMAARAQEKIDTLARGAYVCELPGSADGRPGIEQSEASFTILSASRYSAPQGTGTYLRRGNTVKMTSGPRNGEHYRLQGRNFLRLLDKNGEPTRLRCLRSGQAREG